MPNSSSPVRIKSEKKYPSSPVRVTNLKEMLDYLAEHGVIDTTGMHIEEPPRWDDLRFPAQGLNPAGGANPPAVDNSLTSFPGTYLFAGAQENDIGGIAQMPHTWKEGTAVHPHIHWAKVTADASNLAVGWEFEWRVANLGDTFPAFSAWGAHTLQAGDNTSAGKHNLSSFPEIDMTGKLISCIISWALRRTGNTDAYNGQARLFELDFHYEVNTLGSTSLFVK